jgi:hypothetical protein
MNQKTFWDGEERVDERAEAEYRKSVAKITLTNLLEKELKKEAEARPARQKRDFRIGAPKIEEEVTEEVEEKAEAPVTAEHIAAQLVKLWKMGVIKGAEDPEAVFYACTLKEFGGTVQDV